MSYNRYRELSPGEELIPGDEVWWNREWQPVVRYNWPKWVYHEKTTYHHLHGFRTYATKGMSYRRERL